MGINGIGSGESMRIGKEFSIKVDESSEFQNKQLPSATNKPGELSFADSLKQSVNKVNEMQVTANNKVEALVTGESTNIHDTLVAVEKADIALKLMTQVRNKIIDAYQEVMKMQV